MPRVVGGYSGMVNSRSHPATVGVAVLGAGEISTYHLDALNAVEAARVVAVTSRNLGKAEQRARDCGAPHAFADWRKALELPDVDAVVIATPDATHHEIAVASVESGKAVLVQKPVAATLEDARAIQVAAASAGKHVAVSFMHRYFEEIRRLRAMIEEGELGRILTVRLRNATPGPDWAEWFYVAPSAGRGGVVVQLGIHGIDLLEHLFGQIEAVSGRTAVLLKERQLVTGRTVPNVVVDHALALYELPGGVLGSHEMSWAEVAGTDRFRLEVYGTEATAWLRYPTNGLAVARQPGKWTSTALPESVPGRRQHEEFIDTVRGCGPADRTLEEAISGMEVVEALYAASAAGRRVKVARGSGSALV